ncbi:MAG: hypothetical protein ACI4TU_02215 [Candidatus Cryptobacteroides sp.]
MSNYNIKIDLKKMKDVVFAKVDGRKSVIIPVDVNSEIFVGDKGIYLNMTAFELRNPSSYGDTHIIKPSVDKKEFEKMSEEQRKNLPILGNMKERRASQMEAAEIPSTSVEIDDDLPA